ncbi:MAG: hypothetical protein OXQ29_19410 [Rhodospirillaceae bacterium]|nr:hypothetical protein [Rhodospirillaceae bacterium]
MTEEEMAEILDAEDDGEDDVGERLACQEMAIGDLQELLSYCFDYVQRSIDDLKTAVNDLPVYRIADSLELIAEVVSEAAPEDSAPSEREKLLALMSATLAGDAYVNPTDGEGADDCVKRAAWLLEEVFENGEEHLITAEVRREMRRREAEAVADV